MLMGYVPRSFGRPGEHLAIHARSDETGIAHAQLIRFTGGSQRPGEAPAPSESLRDTEVSFAVGTQRTEIGSYAIVDLPGGTLDGPGWSIQFRFSAWPVPKPGREVILALGPRHDGDPLLVLGIDTERRIFVATSCGKVVTSEHAILERIWHFASFVHAANGLCLDVRPTAGLSRASRAEQSLLMETQLVLAREMCLTMGGWPGSGGSFNGRMAQPEIWLSSERSGVVRSFSDVSGSGKDGYRLCWDFTPSGGLEEFACVRGSGPAGRLVNHPQRNLPGPTWNPLAVEPSRGRLDAVHFNSDAITDCGWPVSATMTVPADARAGVYAIRLEGEGGMSHLPFAVPDATAEVAFLLPTLTYLAYANHHMFADDTSAMAFARTHPIVPAEREWMVLRYPELGRSTYDTHEDGCGVCNASRLRPIVNLEPEQVDWLGAGPHHLAADLYVVGWLEGLALPYSVVSDEMLHLEGDGCLGRARVLVTGCHPEYWTAPMMKALDAFMGRGGKLMYLGANGFYWVTSLDQGAEVMEVRRGYAGSRAWSSGPGEDIHAFDGQKGGLWRLRGRPPQSFTGVGHAAQGWGGSVPYRRLPASQEAAVAPFFEGIDYDEPIGAFGFMMGGAAGYEVDRADRGLGTPADALILATADTLPPHYQLSVEDVTNMSPELGGSQHPDVRADMVWYPTRYGGEVFSTGSIAWASAMGWNGGDNNVARLTTNVLRTFLAR